jgi:asparagine synthetase B (glutamine-hydrolysing)
VALPGAALDTEVGGTAECLVGFGWHSPTSPENRREGVARDSDKQLFVAGYLRSPRSCIKPSAVVRQELIDLALSFRRRGQDAFRDLQQEFSIVIWDRKYRQLIAARDRSGPSMLFYRATLDGIVIATDIEQILTGMPELPPLNRDVVLDYLEDHYRDASCTFFHGVLRVPPGTCLVSDRTGVQLARYWGLPKVERLTGRLEALERFRDVMSRAVVERTESRTTTAFEVSGGYDSTTLTALSLRARPSSPQRILVSRAYPNNSDCDESKFVDAFERSFSVSVRRVPISLPLSEGQPLVRSEPTSYVESLWVPYDSELVKLGVRNLICGHGGDQLFWEAAVLADIAAKGRFLDLARELVSRPQYGPKNRLFYLRSSLVGFPSVVAINRKLRKFLASSRPQSPPEWVGEDLGNCWRRREEQRFEPEPGLAPSQAVFRSHIQRRTFLSVQGDDFAWRLDHNRVHRRALGIKLSAPFLDPAVVDFVLALPFHHRFRRGRGKRFLHDAMVDILPQAILARDRRTVFSSIVREAIYAKLRHEPAESSWKVENYFPWKYFIERRKAVLRHPFSQHAASTAHCLHRAWSLNHWIQ